MSRIGKKPIEIPQGVEVSIKGRSIQIKGPKGELTWIYPEEIEIKQEEGMLVVSASSLTKRLKALWGTTRAVVANMVKGVSEGYEKRLEIEGVGYRAQLQGGKLVLYVGFSHPIEITPPESINLSVEKNIITVSGIDKVLVGKVAADIRAARKPEPYKGKGIRYEGELVRRKAGKKTIGADA